MSESNALRVMAYSGARHVNQVLSIPVATQGPASHSGGVVDLARDYTGLDVRWTHKNRLFGGLVYHLTDAVNLYGSVGSGFETPTFNELAYRANGGARLNFDLRPARSLSYEIGAKILWGAGTQLNMAAFRARTTDEIVALTNTGGRSTFQNAGHTTRNGFEAGFVTAFTHTIDCAYAVGRHRARDL